MKVLDYQRTDERETDAVVRKEESLHKQHTTRVHTVTDTRTQPHKHSRSRTQYHAHAESGPAYTGGKRRKEASGNEQGRTADERANARRLVSFLTALF